MEFSKERINNRLTPSEMEWDIFGFSFGYPRFKYQNPVEIRLYIKKQKKN